MKGPACTDSRTSVRGNEARCSSPALSSAWYFVTAPASSGAQGPATPTVAATPIPGVPSPGAAGIGDPYYPLLGNGGYDAIHYTIDLDLDVEAGSILDATTTIDAVATQDLSTFNLDYPGSADRCGHGRRRARRLDAGRRRADDHSGATAPRRGPVSRRKCATTARRRSTKTIASSAAGGRPTTRSSRSANRRVLTSGTRSMVTRGTRRPTRW